jgi:hypothetical protein
MFAVVFEPFLVGPCETSDVAQGMLGMGCGHCQLTYQADGCQLDAMVPATRQPRKDVCAEDQGKNDCFAKRDSLRCKTYTVQSSLDFLLEG